MKIPSASAPLPDTNKFVSEIKKGSYGTVKTNVRKKNIPSRFLKDSGKVATGEGVTTEVNKAVESPMALDLSSLSIKGELAKAWENKTERSPEVQREINSSLDTLGKLAPYAPGRGEFTTHGFVGAKFPDKSQGIGEVSYLPSSQEGVKRNLEFQRAKFISPFDRVVRGIDTSSDRMVIENWEKKNKEEAKMLMDIAIEKKKILDDARGDRDNKVLEAYAREATLGALSRKNVNMTLSALTSPFSKKSEAEYVAHQQTREEAKELESQREKSGAEIFSGVVGSLVGYGKVASSVRGGIKHLPKSVELLATRSPHLWNATVGNFIETSIEMGVKKATDQDYGYQDFLLSLSLNGMGEGVAKGVSNFISTTGKTGVKSNDVDKINDVIGVIKRRNPSATFAEIQEEVNKVTLSNGKSVGDLWFDYKTSKVSSTLPEFGVKASDIGTTKQFAGGGAAPETNPLDSVIGDIKSVKRSERSEMISKLEAVAKENGIDMDRGKLGVYLDTKLKSNQRVTNSVKEISPKEDILTLAGNSELGKEGSKLKFDTATNTVKKDALMRLYNGGYLTKDIEPENPSLYVFKPTKKFEEINGKAPWLKGFHYPIEQFDQTQVTGGITALPQVKALSDGIKKIDIANSLASRGIVAEDKFIARAQALINHLEKLSANKSSPQPSSLEEVISNSTKGEAIDNVAEYRKELVSFIMGGGDKTYRSLRQFEKALGKKYKVDSPRGTKFDMGYTDYISKGARVGKERYESFSKLFELTEGKKTLQMMNEFIDNAESPEFISSLAQFAKERGIELDMGKVGDKSYVYSVIKQADDRPFKSGLAPIVKRAAFNYYRAIGELEKAKGKILAFKDLEEARKEVKGIVSTLVDTSGSVLPKKKLNELKATWGAEALKMKSVDDSTSAIGNVAEKIKREEYKFIKQELSSSYNELVKNARESDKAFYGGVVADGFDEFFDTGDITALRKAYVQITDAVGAKKANVVQQKLYQEAISDEAVSSITHPSGERYDLFSGKVKGGNETGDTMSSRNSSIKGKWNSFHSSIDQVMRTLGETFGTESKFYRNVIKPVYEGQSFGDAEIRNFQNELNYAKLSAKDLTKLRINLYAIQDGGLERLLKANNVMVGKNGELVLPNTRNSILAYFGVDKNLRKITVDDIARISKEVEMNPELKRIKEAILKKTDEIGNELQSIAILKGKPFEKRENYTPFLYRNSSSLSPSERIAEAGDAIGISRNLDDGFFESRTGRPEKYDLDLDFVNMMKAIESQITYKNLAIPLEIAAKATDDGRDAMSENLNRYMRNWIREYATQGVEENQTLEWAVRLGNRIQTFKALAGSVQTIMMQYTSLGETFTRTSSASLKDIIRTSENIEEARKVSGVLAMRRANDAPDIAARAKMGGRATTALEKAEDIMYYLMKRADEQTFNTTWMGAYKDFMKSHRGWDGKTELDFKKDGIDYDALHYANVTAESVFNSIRIGQRPPILRSQLARMGLFLGKTQLNSFLSMMDFITSSRVKGTAMEVARDKILAGVGYGVSRVLAGGVVVGSTYLYNSLLQDMRAKFGDKTVGARELSALQAKAVKSIDDFFAGKETDQSVRDKMRNLEPVMRMIMSEAVYQSLPISDISGIISSYAKKSKDENFKELFERPVFASETTVSATISDGVKAIIKLLEQAGDEEATTLDMIKTVIAPIAPHPVGRALAISKNTKEFKEMMGYVTEDRLEGVEDLNKEWVASKLSKAKVSLDDRNVARWKDSFIESTPVITKDALKEAIISAPNEVKEALGLGFFVDGKFVTYPSVSGDDVEKVAKSLATKYVELKSYEGEYDEKVPKEFREYLTITSPKVSAQLWVDTKLEGLPFQLQQRIIATIGKSGVASDSKLKEALEIVRRKEYERRKRKQ